MKHESVTRKLICELDGLKEYKDYYVTIEGDVFSTKYNSPRKVKCNWVKSPDSYHTVRLSNGKGENRTFYVHRLVALSFLPNPSQCNKIHHIDGNLQNNHLTNLKWIGKRKIKRNHTHHKKDTSVKDYIDPDCLILNKNLSDIIRLVHYAAVTKGIPTPVKDYDFFHKILEESLHEYVNRYGLKKIIHQLQNS